MKAYPGTNKLKNGQSITIRHARVEDAPQLLETKRKYIAESPYIPLLPEEYTQTLEEEIQLIQNYINQVNSVLLIAECEGKIVGNIDLTGATRIQLQHTAMIGIGILSEYRRNGIGYFLMKHAMDWVQSNEHINLIWLEVYLENTPAIQLYEKLGFKTVGSIPGFFKLENTLSEKLIMYWEKSKV